MFADKTFDGDPVQIYEPKGDEPVVPPTPLGDDAAQPGSGPEAPPGPGAVGPIGPGMSDTGDAEPRKYVIGGSVNVTVARERVQYLNAEGKLITESLRDYTRINLAKAYESLDQFLQAWNSAERKAALIEELERQGVFLDALAEEVGKDLDPFDLLLHVAYGQPPLTRRERAQRVKKRNVFTQYGPVARKVLDTMLDKYADEGITTIEADNLLSVPPFTDLGRPAELVKSFGGRPQYIDALRTLERELYAPGAN